MRRVVSEASEINGDQRKNAGFPAASPNNERSLGSVKDNFFDDAGIALNRLPIPATSSKN
jgi:hypothetical protein